MKSFLRSIAVGITLGLLAGCGINPASHPIVGGDGYQFGDITGGVLAMQAEYCAEADPRRRAFRIAALRAAGVPIPPSGACSDIIALVPTHDLYIDVDQAEADRQRFQSDVETD